MTGTGNGETALALLDEAVKMLANVKTIDDAIVTVDKTVVLKYAVKKARLGLEAQNKAAELHIQAQRKAGEILQEMDKAKAGRPPVNRLPEVTDFARHKTYEELGINKKEAHVWQTFAKIPEKQLFDFFRETTNKQEELTSGAVYRFVKDQPIQVVQKRAEWVTPALTEGEMLDVYDNLYIEMVCNAIRDAGSHEYGNEPTEWLLYSEISQSIFKRFGLPYDAVKDWVESGCESTPLHEVLIRMLEKRYAKSKYGDDLQDPF